MLRPPALGPLSWSSAAVAALIVVLMATYLVDFSGLAGHGSARWTALWWLHTVALVIAWGYYGILGRIAIPALARSLDSTDQARALADIERRAVPLVLLSVVLFTITGRYLLVVDPAYAGLGNVFGSTWTVLMLAK